MDVGTLINNDAEQQLLQVYHQSLVKWGQSTEHLELEDSYPLQEDEESEPIGAETEGDGDEEAGGEEEGGEEKVEEMDVIEENQ